jgi:probable rRNA maturation factor
MSIQFFFEKNITLLNRKRLKEFLIRLTEKENKKIASISIVFCSNEYLLEINRTHLNHDYYTDIITFDLSTKKSDLIEAELYISTDMIKENASIFKTTIQNELHRVVFHGILHLCGYKDKKKPDRELMRSKENEYLDLYFKHK